jgi:short-subunit dehydrogenase
MGTLNRKQRILITGASRGIGRATALLLASRGHDVVLAARDEARLDAVAADILALGRGAAESAPMDVTDASSVRRTIDSALARGPIDVLVNNAGVAHQCEFLDQTEASQRAEMELNYFGMLRVTRALLPSLIERRRGVVVNVSSLLGTVGTPTTTNYGATKAALELFSHGLRGEVERFGVHVTVFVAPHTQTELGGHTDFRGVRSLPVEYVARELVRAIDRAPRRYAASPVYRLLLRFAAWFPVFMESRLVASVEHLLSTDRPSALTVSPRQ